MAQHRRGNGEGSIRQRSNGTWQASVMTGYHADGRRRMKYFSAPTRKEAKAKLDAYLNDRASGLRVDEAYTLAEWLDVFMESHRSQVKAVTFENYRYMLAIIKEHPISNMKLQNVRPMDIDSFLQDLLDDDRSYSAVTKIRSLLFMALHSATGQDLLRRNPVAFCRKLKQRTNAAKQPCFTEEEMRILMQELPEDRIGHSIRLLLATGLRTQELLALTPNSITPDGSSLTVSNAVTMVRGTAVVSTPKSHAGYRVIPIPEIARKSAIFLRVCDTDYIWSVGDPHKPANPSTFRTAYKRAIDAIPGVTYRPPHSCRRAFISLMQAQQVDVLTLQQLAGHRSAAMTQHYVTVHPSIQQDAIARFDSVFQSNLPLDENTCE